MNSLIVFGLLISAMAFTPLVQAQTANEVINKHITAMAGKEKLASLITMKMEGNLNVQGTEITLVITKSRWWA
jgi:hypothetical protein